MKVLISLQISMNDIDFAFYFLHCYHFVFYEKSFFLFPSGTVLSDQGLPLLLTKNSVVLSSCNSNDFSYPVL